MSPKVLVTGACGQIGSELVPFLAGRLGPDNIISLDLVSPPPNFPKGFFSQDIMDSSALRKLLTSQNIGTVYHLVSLLSAAGEKDPQTAWRVNIGSLKNLLDLSVELKFRLFWPSSIAAFGPTTPRDRTPQHTVMAPTTMYGVTKVAGELLCQYYYHKFGIDVRSLRYPGLISWKTPPGGGTTDYAVAVFYEGLATGLYTCFVRPDTVLPMMYMDDAIRATFELMSAPREQISVHTSYNLAGISFSISELVSEINKTAPVQVDYQPDFRQEIADSWPRSIDDSVAAGDWHWRPEFDLPRLVEVMLTNLKNQKKP
jgi:nucleoside-diphosphate-sugar epimerase